jgi:hypothetical protein
VNRSRFAVGVLETTREDQVPVANRKSVYEALKARAAQAAEAAGGSTRERTVG